MTDELSPIRLKIAELQDAILQVHPKLPILLKEIHTILKNDPAVVTVLDETEIASIVNGLKLQTKTEITASALKKKTSLKSVGLGDL
jgi:hypothetical protein